MKFFVPPTLEKDFDDFLNTDVPNQVQGYELLKDWYAQLDSGYKPTIVRCEVYPDSTKSRYENTDNYVNVRASLSSGIVKGDMLRDAEGNIYVLDWDILKETNNIPTRGLRCNMFLTVERVVPDETDQWGYLIQEAGLATIVNQLPCNSYRYDGRPEYATHTATPGITVNALTITTAQYNDQTKNLKIGDEFIWGNEWFTIVDIDWSGVDKTAAHGTLRIVSRKKAGGQLDG